MTRLIVEGVSGEKASFVTPPTQTQNRLYVAISRAEDGSAVTGLSEGNFRLAWSGGDGNDAMIAGPFKELSLEPGDAEPAGLYRITVTHENPLTTDLRYVYCIHVQMIDADNNPAQGVGIVSVISRNV
jgi:hypothetical protein